MHTPTVTPFLWFNDNAEEAADFYTAIFERKQTPSPQANEPTPRRKAMSVEFELNGQRFIALNGGPLYQFNEAVSFFISCETQEEIDYFWNALTDGGTPGRCGWLKDRFGLSWQVVPRTLGELLGRGKALQAMMGMSKLDIAALRAAAEQKP